ncbi:MAG: fibrobacter succinogenes major paralogous domain-containing protein [Bacteroidales bacterium]|nr:fibrobacter succinogenes major paralogous domain-containing protein [Bacteroidales bacterium]
MYNLLKTAFLFMLLIIVTNTSFSQEILKDFEGNQYKTVEIAGHLWMAENLKSTKNSEGDSIESYCFYNDSNYCKTYGRLYPWNSLNIGSEDSILKDICPKEWHIPSDEDWSILIDSLGGIMEAGTKLKNDEHPAFNIQFGGNYNPAVKIFSYIDDHAYFWTSTKFSNSASWMRQLGLYNKNINRSTVPIIYAFSVRCVKD